MINEDYEYKIYNLEKFNQVQRKGNVDTNNKSDRLEEMEAQIYSL